MIKSLMKRVLGTRFDRERKRLQPVLDQIHAAEERLKALSETELKSQTQQFRDRLAERTQAVKGELEEVRAAKHGCADPVERDRLEQRFHELESQYKKELKAGLDEILPEAFATVREACRRLVGTDGDGDRPRADRGTWCPTTCSSSAASSCTWAGSPRWRPARARRWSRRCRST